jgi:4-amino-4-deoxy-L-arabinose transferase-like glycosyltransferase
MTLRLAPSGLAQGRPVPDISRRAFVGVFLIILTVGGLLRGLFPAADPPWNPTVGIVWHDEGAWVHNARNKALFGAWTLDTWNPVYIAPAFTALEYASFSAFGVGVRQARLVPEVCGVWSVWLLGLGVARIAGRRAGLIAAALIATNYIYVMWNRAALMEGPMIAFMVAAWYCQTRARDRAEWGAAAGMLAVAAFFTKASAAFFVGAVGLDAILQLVRRGDASSATGKRAAWWTLAGLAAAGVFVLAIFVLPHWSEYRFYNWQMSVTRKPSYTLKSLVDRTTWLPLQDVFTYMWFVTAVGTTAALGLLARWRELTGGERLLLRWPGLGALELMVHDAGNERRFVLFIPPLVALAAIALGRREIVPEAAERVPRVRALVAAPVILYATYVVAASAVRLAFLREISPNVRIAAAVAVVFTAVLYATWPRIPRLLARGGWNPSASMALALLLSAGFVLQYIQWARGRTYKNYIASIELGRTLPPGTLVHGKLANGLALENRIRPIFIGRGFGNYDDRKTRDDVRYILTYVAPSLGYESQAHDPVILEVINAYPDHRIIRTFDVAETATGHDRAALIDKFGGGRSDTALSGRAKD